MGLSPDEIRQAQDRILAALDKVEDVTCAECDALIMLVFSVRSGWMWMAVYGQETVPAAQCPQVPGLYNIGHGPHQPKSAQRSREIPFRTGDPT